MKIKNQFSKKKIDRYKKFENTIINIKKRIRNKTSRIIPLTSMEKFLYADLKSDFSEKNTKIPRGKYIKINDIFLLNIISKKDYKQLYAGLLNLYKDNYLKGYLGGELRTSQIKESIYDYGSLTNNNKWSQIVSLTPKDKELFELCEFIDISIFEISNELIGISFDLNVNESFNKELNRIINENIEVKTVYEKIRYRKKYVYSKSLTSVTEKRKDNYENFILEFKCRFNKLFSKYLPLQLDYKNKPPISINTYQTNFNVKNRNEIFYNKLGILDNFSAIECENINICKREKGKSDTYVKTKMWYNIIIAKNEVDRSNSILYYLEDPKYSIIHSSSEFVNLFIESIAFYLLDEMQEDLTSDNFKLYKSRTKNVRRNYQQYQKINEKYYKYSSLFNGIRVNRFEYKDEYLEKGFKNLNKTYKEYTEQLNQIKKEYEFRTNINSIKSTYILSIISTLIAIIALISSIFFEYRKDDYNNILILIEKQNNSITETINENK